jgi:hypothetical protein
LYIFILELLDFIHSLWSLAVCNCLGALCLLYWRGFHDLSKLQSDFAFLVFCLRDFLRNCCWELRTVVSQSVS